LSKISKLNSSKKMRQVSLIYIHRLQIKGSYILKDRVNNKTNKIG